MRARDRSIVRSDATADRTIARVERSARSTPRAIDRVARVDVSREDRRNDTRRRARDSSRTTRPTLVSASTRATTRDMDERKALLFQATLAERAERAEGARDATRLDSCRPDVSATFGFIARATRTARRLD